MLSFSRGRLRRLLSCAVLVLVALGLTTSFAAAQEIDPGTDVETPRCPGPETGSAEPRLVEVLPLRGGFFDPPVAAQVTDVLDLAEQQGSELVVLQYSSAGGVSVDLDELLARMESATVPIAALIGPLGTGAEAAGAAGLVWAAADIRAISADATVGPISPADLADADGSAAHHLERLLAAAGADPSLTDRVLTQRVDADELVDAGAVTLTAQGLEPLLVELDGRSMSVGGVERTLELRACDLEVRFHSLGLVRRLLHAATTAPFIYLLLVVGLGMLLFELFQPGFGVAGLAGIVTTGIGVFGLTVLPVTWWSVALVVLGLLLYAVDTAVAGFGPITLAATISFVLGSIWFYAADPLMLDPWLIAATTLTVLVFFVFVMTTVLRAQAGPEGLALEDLVGKPGIVRSVLNPEGHVYIDGALWRARWTGEAKRAKVGTPVRVHAVEGPVVLVEPFEPPGGEGGAADPVGQATRGGVEG